MTQEKYYTPSIEDLRVGYECEIFDSRWDSRILDSDDFSTRYYGEQNTFDGLAHCSYKKGEDTMIVSATRIRTPYLTKEQIEAEGWTHNQTVEGGNPSEFVIEYRKPFGIGFNSLSMNQNRYFHIYTWNAEKGSHTLFGGEIPSVNELRTICKLLKIN